MGNKILEVKNVSKTFLAVKALDSINFEIEEGEIHGLVGENGAGKSTMMKILAGVYGADSGDIYINGSKAEILNPKDSEKMGLSFIHQELYQISNFSVAENLYVGEKYPKNKLGLINWKEVYNEGKEYLKRFEISDNLSRKKLSDVSVAHRYVLAIEKAVSKNSKIIFMDEPTASLTKEETERLFEIIRNLRKCGVSVVFVSHKLEEIFTICDRVTVMRSGQWISTRSIKDITIDNVIYGMLGEKLEDKFPKMETYVGKEILSIKELSGKKVPKNSFNLNSGEILGVIGLVGSGRTELVRLLIGADKKDTGEIYLNGKLVQNTNPKKSLKNGFYLIPEDRQDQGLMMNMSITENVTISNIRNYCFAKLGLINRKKEEGSVNNYVEELRIKASSSKQKVKDLSGGNQQKVIIARGYDTKSNIYIFDEPTKGVDVGAKTEIYLLMQKLAKSGAGVIFISTEVEEVIGITDRFYVMRKGKIVVESTPQKVTTDKLSSIIQIGTTEDGESNES